MKETLQTFCISQVLRLDHGRRVLFIKLFLKESKPRYSRVDLVEGCRDAHPLRFPEMNWGFLSKTSKILRKKKTNKKTRKENMRWSWRAYIKRHKNGNLALKPFYYMPHQFSYDDQNDIYSVRYCAVRFRVIQNLLDRLFCIFQRFTLCFCLGVSLHLHCPLWKSVYVPRQLSHFLVVQPLLRKILDPPQASPVIGPWWCFCTKCWERHEQLVSYNARLFSFGICCWHLCAWIGCYF